MSVSAVIAAVAGLFGKAIEPIVDLVDDERFTAQEKAQIANTQALAAIANEKMVLEIERLGWQVEVEYQKRQAAEARAAADAQSALAQIQQAQTQEDDLYTKRLRPTVGYLMTILFIADFCSTRFFDQPRFFGRVELIGYFSLLGVYIGGRSFEKTKRKQA